MQMFVGITNNGWFDYISSHKFKEVNFWKPSKQTFHLLKPNELFLFKLHSPFDYIVGGGFFVKFSLVPPYFAWDAFGEENGAPSRAEFYNAIRSIRKKNKISAETDQIGCIILTDVFTFDESRWIPIPAGFKKNIVTGKAYNTEEGEGKALYREVLDRLGGISLQESENQPDRRNRYVESLTKHRLGQGAFRVSIMDAYNRRCAITGEKTLPVLEAAHIKPYADEGPHEVSNGIFLKSDFHTLFDDGYITIDPSYRIEVSKRLFEDYGNGKDYYKYHGKELLILPAHKEERPNIEYLRWHNETLFKG